MFRRKLMPTPLLAVILAGITAVSLLAQTPLPPVPDGAPESEETEFFSEDDAEALNRGAIHEAFATPADNEPVVGLIVNRQPPDPIDEVPPELKPEGENIVWISGYFSFDEELDDFVWISGMWRDVPPGRTWVPGYWHEIENGWQWVHGYWADESADEITYQPEPPASQEYGPSSPSPGNNYFYIPGSWVYVNYNYNWRPGYWAPYQPNWIWVPARYAFTPRGYVYIPGYWDYLLRNRGVAYAPVRFHRYGLRRRFRPVVLIDSWEHLLLHLFVRPRFGYYSFGNYYGNRYNNFYQPWYAYHRSRGGYDPLFVNFHIRYGDTGYNRLVGWNRYFHNHSEFRPRTTYREQRNFLIQNRDTTDRSILAATSLASNIEQIQKSPRVPVSFRKVELAEQTAITKSIQDVRKVSLQRTRLEGRAKGFGNAKIQKTETQKFEIPKLVQQQRVPGISDRISNRGDRGAKSGNPALTERKPPELPTILGNRGQAGRTLPRKSTTTLSGEETEPSTTGPGKTEPRKPSTRIPLGNRNPRTTQTKPTLPSSKPGTTPKLEPGKPAQTPRINPRTPDTNSPRTKTPPSRTPNKPSSPTIRNRSVPNSAPEPKSPTITPPKQNPSTSSKGRTPPVQRSTNSKKPETPAIPKRTIPNSSSQPRAPSIKPTEREPSSNSRPTFQKPTQRSTNSSKPSSPIIPKQSTPKPSSQPKAPSIKLPERKPSSSSRSTFQNRTPPAQRSSKPSTPVIPKRSTPKPSSQPKAPSIKLPERKPSTRSSSTFQKRTPPVQRSSSSKPKSQAPPKTRSFTPSRSTKSSTPPKRSSSTINRSRSSSSRSTFSKPSASRRQAPQVKPKSSQVKAKTPSKSSSKSSSFRNRFQQRKK